MDTVDEVRSSLQVFGYIDFAIFILMLIVCLAMGLYFGYEEKQIMAGKNDKQHESMVLNYLLGGRKMKIFPVAMSLIASWASGITLLGIPTEIYLYGSGASLILSAVLVSTFVTYYIFLPIYMDLKLISIFEYLEKRFSQRVQMLGSIAYSMGVLLYGSIVIYTPAIAFNQVTGISINLITPLIAIVCVTYTCIGGMKAVIWTDLFQITLMYGTVIFIAIKGTIDVGGVTNVWRMNYDSGRIEFPTLEFDPTIRHSFYSLVIGGSIYWIQANCTGQAMMQRYLSLPSLNSARKALILFAIGVFMLQAICYYNGFLIYTKYQECDPITTKLATAKDQLVPIFVMDIAKNIPGVPGLFIVGIFSAALSSLSTGLNSLSAIIIKNTVSNLTQKPLSKRLTNLIMRGTVICFGMGFTAMVYVVQRMGTIFQLVMSVEGIFGGPQFSVFLMGITMPWINEQCAFYGEISGIITMTWFSYQVQMAQYKGDIKLSTKNMTTTGCSYNYTIYESPTDANIQSDADDLELFRISYLYILLLGITATLIFAHFYTLFFGLNRSGPIDENLLAPFTRSYYKKFKFTKLSDTAMITMSADVEYAEIKQFVKYVLQFLFQLCSSINCYQLQFK